MSFIHQIISYVGGLAIAITSALGYPGLVFLMALESMVVPLPSELILPFAGFLVAQGQFDFGLAVLAAAAGSLIGSLISYAMGYYGGDKFVRTFGKYCLLDESDLNVAERWFARRGELTIFISRFVPVVRHLISIPAGIGKMNLIKFSFYTLAGAAIWNTILLYLGYVLGDNWAEIRKYSEKLSLLVALLLILILVFTLWRHSKHKHKKIPA
ncbi:MAG: DedA family protein [Candidatus Buchananbacteria bacterium]